MNQLRERQQVSSKLQPRDSWQPAGEHAAGVQPYADTLVSMLLMSLPWADETLARGSGEAMTNLLDLVGQYMEARPVQSSSALQPFLESAGEDDLAAQSDSGAASFLSQVSL